MKVNRRIAVVAAREVKRLAAIAAERAVRAESFHKQPSFRRLTDSETEAILGGRLWTALSGARRRP